MSGGRGSARSWRASALAGAAALALVAPGCGRAPDPPPPVTPASVGGTGVAAPPPARTAQATPPAAGSAVAARPVDTIDRYFGGRTPAWWQARLTELRKEGPPELYALATRRARAAGLTVEERGDAVSAEPPPRGVYR